jgi:hypothetical protein
MEFKRTRLSTIANPNVSNHSRQRSERDHRNNSHQQTSSSQDYSVAMGELGACNVLRYSKI